MQELTLGWSDDRIPIGSHVCYFYSGDDVLKRTLAFIRAGLDEPDEVGVIFADASRFDGLLAWLQEGYDGDVVERVRNRRLLLIGGAPDLPSLLSGIGGELDRAVAEGCRAIRFLGFIAWGQPGWPDDRTILEFESRVNKVVMAYPAAIVCTYGVPTLTGPQLIHGGTQTHPILMIADTVVRANPLYVPPERFLAELASETD
ncbi:MAG TPA: MEDS domain-containing protein [Candidatus Dormibacteraeota bacterium]|jgi:hypothetical protein|nr:MEDS domain-containing protein [Candidatus Dormibacteraeota bacterium]